jgi:hypothetical protein
MIEFQYIGTEVRPVYGGKRIEAKYTLTHTKNGRVNKYSITAEIRGIESRDLHFGTVEAEWIGDIEESNDETLTAESAADLFEESI